MVNWRVRNSVSSVTHITDHVVLFVFFKGYFFLSLRSVVKFSRLEKLNMNSFKSVEVWRHVMAEPGMSVTSDFLFIRY